MENYKKDVKADFSQTDEADRDVVIVSPKHSDVLGKVFWLLLTTAYRFVSSNAKCQVMSDEMLDKFSFQQMTTIPQLFIILSSGILQYLLETFLMKSFLLDSKVYWKGRKTY